MWNTLQWPRGLLLNLSHNPTVVHGKSMWEETRTQDLGPFCASCIGTPVSSVKCPNLMVLLLHRVVVRPKRGTKRQAFLKSPAPASRRELQMLQSIVLQSSSLPWQMKGLEHTSVNLWGFGERKSDSLQIKENCDLEKWHISVSLCVWNLFIMKH